MIYSSRQTHKVGIIPILQMRKWGGSQKSSQLVDGQRRAGTQVHRHSECFVITSSKADSITVLQSGLCEKALKSAFSASIIIAFPSLHHHQRLYLTSTHGITHLENLFILQNLTQLSLALYSLPCPSPLFKEFILSIPELVLLPLHISKCCNTE